MSGENDQMIGMIVLKYLIINFIEAKSSNRIPTELLPPASVAVGSHPDAVELFGSIFYEVFVAA